VTVALTDHNTCHKTLDSYIVYVEAISRSGGKDYYPLAIVIVLAVHENCSTAVHALYTGLHSERGLLYETW
jgi:hypothetical protein